MLKLRKSEKVSFCKSVHDSIRSVSSRVGLHNLPLQVYVMQVITFVLSFARNMSFPYLAMYLTGNPAERGLGIDASLVGVIIMVGGLAGTFALLFTGSLCDKFGRRKMMLCFILPQVILTASYAYAKTYPEFLIIYAVGGVIGSFYDPAFNAMVIDLVHAERREEIFGLSYMIMNVGTVVGPPVGGFIASRSGYPVVFIYTALLTSVCAAIMLLWIKESHSRNISGSVTLRQLFGIFKHRTFVLLCLLGALTNVVYSQLYGLLSVYTGYIGFEPYFFGILFSINGVMVVLLQIPIRKGAMRIGSTKAFIIAQTFYAVGFGYFMFSKSFIQFLTGIVILTVGEITYFPAVSGFVSNLAPSDKRGRYMAFLGLFFGIGGSAGSYIGFQLYGILENKGMIWGLLGAVAFATLPGYAYLLKIHRRTKLSEDTDTISRAVQ